MSKKNKKADYDTSGYSDIGEGKVSTFFVRNRRRNLKALIAIILCIVLVVSAIGVIIVKDKMKKINYSEGTEGNPNESISYAEDEYESDPNFANMSDIEDAESIKDYMKSWATNGGELMYSNDVINVLLIGEDNEDGSSRSDSMILASVNTKTKKITLCSFLRDSYTYMMINGQERYDKTNHSYVWAGASKVMEVLSNNYKIKIDHYVSIDYKGFKKVIDLLGGVTVNISESEASYMNRTTKYDDFKSGQNTLDGNHALIFSRIRKLDSEVERTRRQRSVIASVIQNVKTSSISDINKAADTFLPYVTTNYKESEIISLASKALSDKWYDYEIVGMAEPSENYRVGVNGFTTYTGNLFVWIVDYVRAAQELQTAMYGKTNIVISADHKSAIDMVYGGNYNSDDNNNNDDYYDDDDYYDETTRRRVFDDASEYASSVSERVSDYFTAPSYGNNNDDDNDDDSYNDDTPGAEYDNSYDDTNE